METHLIEEGKKNINKLCADGDLKLIDSFKEVAPDFSKYILSFVFGTIYSRKELGLKIKQIITLTSLAVQGGCNPQLGYHIKGALNLGISQEEIISIFIHIAAYSGFPKANNAISIAKKVFQENNEKNQR